VPGGADANGCRLLERHRLAGAFMFAFLCCRYQKLAGPILDKIDKLEKVFETFGH